MAHIDFYFSPISTFTYLAGTRLDDILAKHKATVTYKPVNLGVLFDRNGAPRPADRPQSRKDYRLQELRRVSQKLGMNMNIQPAFWPTNPAPASYAIIAAQEARKAGASGDLSQLINTLFRAIFEQERDIADDVVITAALKDAGFDPMLSMTGMLKGAEIYAKNTEEAFSSGVFGAPFYIVSEYDERFWGQDRLADLDSYLGSV